MSEVNFTDSPYRFTDPVRFFKANDPYYFEVDNIPLKQLQENCLWLKDQLRSDAKKLLLGVKRSDIDELRPYASGGDRILRVSPGRYTARINDASSKSPLAYLNKVMGEAVGDVDAFEAALPNDGTFPNGKNAILKAALEQFKSVLSEDAMGMTGLTERVFTWPVVNSDYPVGISGASFDSDGSFGDSSINNPGGGASWSPRVVSQALVWAKSVGSTSESTLLPTFETTNPTSGWAKFPRTENFFIKRWRGVSRLSVVDVSEELTIEVPQFDSEDFSYINSEGEQSSVNGVHTRIDMVFIYSKPIDSSGVNIIKGADKEKITSPQLGIVHGAGIRTNFQESTTFSTDHKTTMGDPKILASPGDQNNENMGFTSTSANDIAYDVRGSFPSPDDILNLAPLISERLEESAMELVGQSILPVAYIWVRENSQVVLSTDVIDIRPMFRTAELSYNERAGLAAALPQLSLANPAVGKGQLDYELRRVRDELRGEIDIAANASDVQKGINTLAVGYVFGGWNFGPEGALYDFYQKQFAADNVDDNDSDAAIKSYIISKYGIGNAGTNIPIPSYPDWDLSYWAIVQDVENKGLYPNDYMNTLHSRGAGTTPPQRDITVVAGSIKTSITPEGLTVGGNTPTRMKDLSNFEKEVWASKVNFNYVSKKIKFNRGALPWLADYKVEVDLVNCLAESNRSTGGTGRRAGSYFGHWVEKGFDEFTIYVAFVTVDNNDKQGDIGGALFPAPH